MRCLAGGTLPIGSTCLHSLFCYNLHNVQSYVGSDGYFVVGEFPGPD
jgi:hypothetical protein